MYEKKSLQEALQENIKTYIAPPHLSGPDIFQAHHELSIARFALTKQAEVYYKAVEILTEKLDQASSLSQDDPKLFSDVMVCLNAIELRSIKLIESAQKVTTLLKSVVDLDVDKASLRTMLVNLPSLVKDAIASCTQDENLADKISFSLSCRIDSLMTEFRFREESQLPTVNAGNTPAITHEDYLQLLNSVPTQPN